MLRPDERRRRSPDLRYFGSKTALLYFSKKETVLTEIHDNLQDDVTPYTGILVCYY